MRSPSPQPARGRSGGRLGDLCAHALGARRTWTRRLASPLARRSGSLPSGRPLSSDPQLTSRALGKRKGARAFHPQDPSGDHRDFNPFCFVPEHRHVVHKPAETDSHTSVTQVCTYIEVAHLISVLQHRHASTSNP